MYLKKLTLRGFKSFASATVLNFEPGITCIVGPNGSGKSNVVDALSWVMGEQGVKSLRGGKMEDVIFAGTTVRAPLGRAEVVLTIDNSDGALPIEYSEVTISRTMFRNGGSEYAINNHPARLLDVQELLSDSGIGNEMHVIVGQGQLDAILQANPEARRGFVEEAAGILKHRKRKEKAVRKLDATKTNLERLTDLITEIRRQLRPLGKQAAVARKAAVIQAELRDAKSRLLANELVKVHAALQADLADEDSALKTKSLAESRLSAGQEYEIAADKKLKLHNEELTQANELWFHFASLRERVSTTISISADRMRHGQNQPQLQIMGRDPEKLESEASQLRAEEAELRQKVERANTVLAEATVHRNSMESAYDLAEKTYASQLRAIADRREGLARLTGQVESMKSRLDASAEEVDRLIKRHEEALQRNEKANQGFQELETELAGLSGSESDLDANYEAVTSQLAELSVQSGKYSESETRLKAKQGALQARLDALQLAAQRKDGSSDLLKADLVGIQGRIPDVIKVETGWESAVSAALQNMAEAIVVEDHDAALGAVELLKSKDLGRAGLLVGNSPADISSWPTEISGQYLIDKIHVDNSYRGALTRLLWKIVAVDGTDFAVDVVKKFPDLTAVTRDGEIFSSWMVVGGSKVTSSLIEVQASIEQTKNKLQKTQSELEELRSAKTKLDIELKQVEKDEAELLERLHNSDAKLSALADQLASSRQSALAATQEASRLSEAIKQAKTSRKEDEVKFAALKERLILASQEEITEPDSAERDELAAKARQARTAEMEARLALRTAEERIKALTGRADSLMRAAERERTARDKARAKAEQLRKEAKIAQVVNKAALKLAELVDTAQTTSAKQRDLAEEARVNAEHELAKAQEETKKAALALEELNRGRHQNELARIELRMRIEQLEDKALTELGLEPDTLMNDFGPNELIPVLAQPDGTAFSEDDEIPNPIPFNLEEQTKRLKTAEKNLAILGRVNPLALEEFDAMSQRHKFLAEQLDDLKRTRNDLLDIISEVDAKVEEVFTAAYQDVEKAFSDVFTRLFPGGQGKLVLTDPEDMLNTGIEVEARPAGKKLKRLSLLSGGERSLVAVAFLVSLFIARPSPFYILDEVEAALDEANLGRLLGIYERLRANSQLLVITHQKRTMEIADCLYGVTMRNDGVSTVVSQRIAN